MAFFLMLYCVCFVCLMLTFFFWKLKSSGLLTFFCIIISIPAFLFFLKILKVALSISVKHIYLFCHFFQCHLLRICFFFFPFYTCTNWIVLKTDFHPASKLGYVFLLLISLCAHCRNLLWLASVWQIYNFSFFEDFIIPQK